MFFFPGCKNVDSAVSNEIKISVRKLKSCCKDFDFDAICFYHHDCCCSSKLFIFLRSRVLKAEINEPFTAWLTLSFGAHFDASRASTATPLAIYM